MSEDATTNVGGIAGDQLASYIERIERLEEEKATLQNDMKEVFAEAKGNGFDVKIMRQILKLRKMQAADRSEQEELLELYKRALGMDTGPDSDPDDTGADPALAATAARLVEAFGSVEAARDAIEAARAMADPETDPGDDANVGAAQ